MFARIDAEHGFPSGASACHLLQRRVDVRKSKDAIDRWAFSQFTEAAEDPDILRQNWRDVIEIILQYRIEEKNRIMAALNSGEYAAALSAKPDNHWISASKICNKFATARPENTTKCQSKHKAKQ